MLAKRCSVRSKRAKEAHSQPHCIHEFMPTLYVFLLSVREKKIVTIIQTKTKKAFFCAFLRKEQRDEPRGSSGACDNQTLLELLIKLPFFKVIITVFVYKMQSSDSVCPS